jgi:anaerobic magnesium-protoporphyrin IX monomethyl ester cyclase
MRILLVNPQSTGIFTTIGTTLPPMGLLYVAASLEHAGHSVRVIDLQLDPFILTREDLEAADVVGITSDTTRVEKALQLARQASSMGKTVVMGGPHPQFVAAEVLGTGHVHFIIKGEGELSFPQLLKTITNGGDPAATAGVIFRNGDSVVETPNAQPPDVELLPLPARHLVDLRRYPASLNGVPITPVVTSRGCPGGCSFCSSSNFFGRGWRQRSPESVLAELDEVYHRYGFRGVAFVDDNFSLDPERVIRIANGIGERSFDLTWWNFSRVDTISRNPKMVQAMAAAGSKMVYLGIESATDEVLRDIGKKGQIAEAAAAVKVLKDNGIAVFGSYIVGHPNEHRRDIERTIDLAVQLDSDIAQFSILTPYPGTALDAQLKDRIFIRRWKFYDGLHLVFRHAHINRHFLQFLLLKSYFRFYRRSLRARTGFKAYGRRQDLGLRKVLACVFDLFF